MRKSEIYRKKGMDYAIPCSSRQKDSLSPGISPTALKNYYRLNPRHTGKGITVGIILAFENPDIQRDMDKFCSEFGLPDCSVEVVTFRKNNCISPDIDKWQTEASLDTQWIHAFAPDARIVCYISGSDDFEDLFSSVFHAGKECDIIALCFGKREFAGLSYYESILESTPSLCICAAGNGDFVSYPACSLHVISVGGTEIFTDAYGSYAGHETAWKTGGGGISKYLSCPEFQKNIDFSGRSVPDISFFADGCKGASVFLRENLICCRGTSVSTACITGLCACLMQHDRDLKIKKAGFFYELAFKEKYAYSKYFKDIKEGRSGKRKAHVGFDLCTGLGVPLFDRICSL